MARKSQKIIAGEEYMKILGITCYQAYRTEKRCVEFYLEGQIRERSYFLEVIFEDKEPVKSNFLENFNHPRKYDSFLDGYCEALFGFSITGGYYHGGSGYFCKAFVCHEKDRYGNEIKGTEDWNKFVVEVKHFYSKKMIPVLNAFGTSKKPIENKEENNGI
jgi:hypothetical protein